MPSKTETLTAEQRFRLAFERLKAGQPEVLARGTPVSQNNVAKEAGCDPSALRKARYPALIREIQAYLELYPTEDSSDHKAKKQRAVNRSARERMEDAVRQRDQAQSILVSATRRIIELSEEVETLRRKLNEISPPPTRL